VAVGFELEAMLNLHLTIEEEALAEIGAWDT